MIETANRIDSIAEYRINLTPVIDNGRCRQVRPGGAVDDRPRPHDLTKLPQITQYLADRSARWPKRSRVAFLPYNGVGGSKVAPYEDGVMTILGVFVEPMLAFGLPGHMEWIVLLFLGLLIFGRRLPEVGRSLGRGIVEFKRGIKGIDDDIDDESSKPASKLSDWPKQSLDSSAREEKSDQAAGEPEKVTSGQESDDDPTTV